MRRWLCGLILMLTLVSSSGCFVPIYSGDPVRRARQLLYTSENLRMIHDEWERIWFLDPAGPHDAYRTHGGLI